MGILIMCTFISSINIIGGKNYSHHHKNQENKFILFANKYFCVMVNMMIVYTLNYIIHNIFQFFFQLSVSKMMSFLYCFVIQVYQPPPTLYNDIICTYRCKGTHNYYEYNLDMGFLQIFFCNKILNLMDKKYEQQIFMCNVMQRVMYIYGILEYVVYNMYDEESTKLSVYEKN